MRPRIFKANLRSLQRCLKSSWHSAYSLYDSSTGDYTLVPARGSLVIYKTPGITEGNVYSSLPARTEDVLGFNPIVSGIALGFNLVDSGQAESYVQTNDGLFQSGPYPLIANQSKPIARTVGTYRGLGNIYLVTNDDSLTVFRHTQDAGLAHILSHPCVVLSNFVMANGYIVFVAKDGIYVIDKSAALKVYSFGSSYIPTDAMVFLADGKAVVAYTSNGTTAKSYVFEPRGGIYESLNYGAVSPKDCSPMLVENGAIPEVVFINHDTVTPAWGTHEMSLVGLTAGDSGYVRTNWSTLMRGGKYFNVTGISILYENTSGSVITPFKVKLYTEGSSSSEAYANTSISVSATETLYHEHLKTGLIRCLSASLYVYDIHYLTTIRDIKLIGYYSEDLL